MLGTVVRRVAAVALVHLQLVSPTGRDLGLKRGPRGMLGNVATVALLQGMRGRVVFSSRMWSGMFLLFVFWLDPLGSGTQGQNLGSACGLEMRPDWQLAASKWCTPH